MDETTAGGPSINTLHGMLTALTSSLDQHVKDSCAWRGATDERLDLMQRELSANTNVTSTISDVVTTTKHVTWALKWISTIAVAVAGIWYALKVAISVGPPPPGIGPSP